MADRKYQKQENITKNLNDNTNKISKHNNDKSNNFVGNNNKNSYENNIIIMTIKMAYIEIITMMVIMIVTIDR